MGVHFQRGQALFALRRYEEAIAEYQQELAEHPGCAASHSNIASALINLGRHREADAAVRQTLALAPNYAHAHYLLSYLKPNPPVNSPAQEAILEAIRWEPSARHFSRLGTLLRAHNKHRESLEAAEQALALDPRYKDALVLRARSLESLGRPDEAAEVLRYALSIDPEDPDIHKNLGEVALAAGDAGEALDALREARRISPVRHHDREKILDAYARRVWPFRYVDRMWKRYRRLSALGQWAVQAAVATALVGVLAATGSTPAHPSATAMWTFIAAFNLLLLLATAKVYPTAVLRIVARRELDVRLGQAVNSGCGLLFLLPFVHILTSVAAISLSITSGVTFFLFGTFLGIGLYASMAVVPSQWRGLAIPVLVLSLGSLLIYGGACMHERDLWGILFSWAAVLAITGAGAYLCQRNDSKNAAGLKNAR